jgi:hypothetical protein
VNTLALQWIVDGLKALGGEAEITPDGQTAPLLLPPDLSSSLKLPEFCTLSLAADAPGATVSASPDFIEKCASLFKFRGSIAQGVFKTEPGYVWPKVNKAEHFLKLSSGKSVFNEMRIQDQTYAVLYARYSAVSDEKREAIVSAGLNIGTRTVVQNIGMHLERCLEEGTIESKAADFPGIPEAIVKTLFDLLRSETSFHLEDFNVSLSKRLLKDCDRIYRYYMELMENAVDVSKSKKVAVEDLKERLSVISREYAKKIDDLRVKYLMKVVIEPMGFLLAHIPCACAYFTVQMGHASREVCIPYNPLASRPDHTLCSHCGQPVETIRLCREFHWVGEKCWKRCAECGKEFCPVCKPKGCVHG